MFAIQNNKIGMVIKKIYTVSFNPHNDPDGRETEVLLSDHQKSKCLICIIQGNDTGNLTIASNMYT